MQINALLHNTNVAVQNNNNGNSQTNGHVIATAVATQTGGLRTSVVTSNNNNNHHHRRTKKVSGRTRFTSSCSSSGGSSSSSSCSPTPHGHHHHHHCYHHRRGSPTCQKSVNATAYGLAPTSTARHPSKKRTTTPTTSRKSETTATTRPRRRTISNSAVIVAGTELPLLSSAVSPVDGRRALSALRTVLYGGQQLEDDVAHLQRLLETVPVGGGGGVALGKSNLTAQLSPRYYHSSSWSTMAPRKNTTRKEASANRAHHQDEGYEEEEEDDDDDDDDDEEDEEGENAGDQQDWDALLANIVHDVNSMGVRCDRPSHRHDSGDFGEAAQFWPDRRHRRDDPSGKLSAK